MVDKNFEFALADLTDAQRATANLLINQYRNQNDTRKQQSGKRQFGLENVHPTALKALIDDSLALIGNAPNTLQKDVSWLHWELLISEVSGHLEGMVLVDPQKVLSPIKGLCEIRLERFNPDGGRNIEINLTKGIVAIHGDIDDNNPCLNVTQDKRVPYGVMLQCGITTPDSEDVHYQIDDMGNIELNDALQACYNAIGRLHHSEAIERLATHVVFMRSLKQLKFNAPEHNAFLSAIHALYTHYFDRKKAKDKTLHGKLHGNKRQGLTETEVMMRTLMTPENIHRAQQKLAYSLEKRELESTNNVIDITAFKQEVLNDKINDMFAQDHPDTW